MDMLQVFALDADRNRLTGSIPYSSLIWDRMYYEPGQFSLVVLSDVYSPDWEYICAWGRTELGIVQKVEVDDTETPGPYGKDVITISGFFLEQSLNDLVFLIEQTEQEEYRIYKPAKVTTKAPTVKQGPDGKLYIEQTSYDGSKHYRNVETGVFDSTVDGSSLTDVSVTPGYGMQYIPNSDTYMGTDYDSYSEDGKTLVTVTPGGAKNEYELVSKPTGLGYSYGGTTSGTVTLYKDHDGNIRWTTGVTTSSNGGYKRKVQEWERKTDGLEKVTSGGDTYAIAYREVKGPWQLRTDVGDVGKEMDNVQQVIEWAQLCFGNTMQYDEPGFEGVTKVIDPSLKRVGDLIYEELKTVGASVRLLYDFEQDVVVFSTWRGLDRTQDQEGDENPFAVFSDTWGTLYDYRASVDKSNYKNKCYVLYDYYEPEWDEDGHPVVKTGHEYDGEKTTAYYYIPQTHLRGYETVRLDDNREDSETWVDMRKEGPEGADDLPDPSDRLTETPDVSGITKAAWDAFKKNLTEVGNQTLANDYCIINSLDTGTLTQDDYLDGWDLGDRVDYAVNRIGMVGTGRIIEVLESYEAGKPIIRPVLGDEVITMAKRQSIN